MKNLHNGTRVVAADSATKATYSCSPVRLLAFLLAAILFQACARQVSTSVHSASRDVLRIAVAGEPANLNPIHSRTTSEDYFEEAIFDGLLKFDPSGRLLPDLATAVPSRENGGISADLLTITYHLRHGVVWQDGAPFTSRDVAFTYRLHVDPKGVGTQYSLYRRIAKVETPDLFTVRITLTKPSVVALNNFFVGAGGEIVPEHILRHEAQPYGAFDSHPVGTGPYRLEKWERGNQVRLVANPRYFGGAPRIPHITVRFVRSSTTRALLLREGQLDVANLAVEDIPSLDGDSSVAILKGRSFDLYFVEFNTKKDPFDDATARRGLAYALDRRLVLKGLGGSGVLAQTLVPSDSWAYDANNGCASFDPRRARALLTNKQRLRFALSYGAEPHMEDLAIKLQQQWRAAGVDVSLRPLAMDVFYGDNGPLEKGSFQVALDGLRLPDPVDMDAALLSQYQPPEGGNSSRYTNRAVDAWLIAAQETYERKARRALYAKVERTVCREAPIIPLYFVVRFYGVSRSLQNFVPNNVSSDLWNVATWYWK